MSLLVYKRAVLEGTVVPATPMNRRTALLLPMSAPNAVLWILVVGPTIVSVSFGPFLRAARPLRPIRRRRHVRRRRMRRRAVEPVATARHARRGRCLDRSVEVAEPHAEKAVVACWVTMLSAGALALGVNAPAPPNESR